MVTILKNTGIPRLAQIIIEKFNLLHDTLFSFINENTRRFQANKG